MELLDFIGNCEISHHRYSSTCTRRHGDRATCSAIILSPAPPVPRTPRHPLTLGPGAGRQEIGDRPEAAAMLRARPIGAQRLLVRRRAIPLVLAEQIDRSGTIELLHHAI